ncbi:MAG: LemA family protein [Candidatus Paceibacterota bacterium]|jgi:LemA protein
MSKKTIYIIIAVVIVILLYVWGGYNGLVTTNLAADTQWSQVETQYQRRFDLIPNLVESVKGVMKQEQAIFTALADARTKYSGSTSADAKAQAAGQVETALGRLLAVVENYPTLKSSENVQTLMSQLEGTENRISVERKRFNETVMAYNLKVKTFPSSLLAKTFGFADRALFDAVSGSEVAPKVSL